MRWFIALPMVALVLLLVPSATASPHVQVDSVRPPACSEVGPEPYVKVDPAYCIDIVVGILNQVVGNNDEG